MVRRIAARVGRFIDTHQIETGIAVFLVLVLIGAINVARTVGAL